MLPPPGEGGRPRLIGVDQTGASLRGGRQARPLPVVELCWEGAWRLSAVGRSGGPRTASSLSEQALGRVDGETAVLVDAVLGLPAAGWRRAGVEPGAVGLRALFDRAASWPGGYGRGPAKAFLATLDPGGDGLRVHDREAGAMSVFRSVPFQREVGTGTYRVWRDLGLHGHAWASLWAHEPLDGSRALLAEAWPSLGWRVVLGRTRREPAALPALLRDRGVRVDDADAAVLAGRPDHADAAVAAVLGAWVQAVGGWSAPSTPPGEGGLLGWGLDAASRVM